MEVKSLNIIIYSRISVDDKSYTIENQLKMCRRYIKDNICESDKNMNWNNRITVEEVSDKGYSGGNMDRPGIRIIEEYLMNKKIDMLIVKDLSRLGRNYIDVGRFINKLYVNNVKLIVLNKDINDDISILLADFYSKDISIKTKSVLDMKKRKGVYSLPKVPYGYRKSDKDKYKIEIYEPEAKYIRMIFNIYKEGYSISEIVTLLNNRECELSSGYNNKSHIIEKKIWNYHRVYRILHNEFYNGIMVYGKTSGHIWEGKKRKNIPRSQWKRIENHHEKIKW